MTSYVDLDATAVAAAVHVGEVSTTEIRDAARAQYLKTHSDINAVVEWYENPTPVASSDGPLAGVPVLRKDYGSTEAGRLTEMGSRLAVGNVASETSQLFTRLRDSGAQVLGRSATPEFVQHGATETTLNGITRNPHNLSLSPGGSSGGAAAAVAAGVVPVAHGSDCAGSIRIPASACGLVGLKPGLNRVQLADGGWGGIANEFVLTKTVRDCRLLLDVLGDGAYLETKPTYRVGLSTTHWAGFDDDAEVVTATRSAASQLAAAGHKLIEVDPPVDYDQLMETFSALFHRWLVSDVDRFVSMGRDAGPATLEPLTLAALEHLHGLTVADISAAQVAQGAITARLERDLADVDILLTPTLGRSTIPLGQLAGEGTDLDTYIRLNDESFPYSYLFNVTGWPSISVPGQMSNVGLPVGVQLSARRGSEHQLLDLAKTLWPDPTG